jgi:DNA-binding PadR family transcriptional regulator
MEPSHGYELKQEYDRLFGSGIKGLSFGQVYGTLSRLERDGQITVQDGVPGDGPDRRRYMITPAGSAVVENWLAEPEMPEPRLQATLFVKVTLALLSGRPAADYLDAQRKAHMARMRQLTEVRRNGPLSTALLADFAIFHLDADLRWIELTTGRLDQLRQEVSRHPTTD